MFILFFDFFHDFMYRIGSGVCASLSVMSDSLQPRGLYPARILCPWNSPDQNTGEGCHFLLQGTFPTQGSNPGLLHCRWILYQLSHKGSPRMLEWVARPFSRGSSRSRNWTGVSCITGRFFINWAIHPYFFSGILYTYIFIEVKFTKLFIHIFYYIF